MSTSGAGVPRPFGGGRGRRARSVLRGATLALLAVMTARMVPWQLVIAGLIASCTALVLVRRSRAQLRSTRELAELLASLRTIVRELAAGAGPGDALREAVAAGGSVAGLLADMLRRTSASRERAADVARPRPTTLAGAITQVRHAWSVSAAYGVPLTGVLTSCIADLEERADVARLRSQQVAGPAVSGYVLACLPMAGIAMGLGLGSNPIGVLLGGPLGGALLVAGVTLCCAGLLWTGRIVRGGADD